jgi:hypothetical protein
VTGRRALIRLGIALALVACVAAAVRSASADAARKPTFKEREGVTAALPAWFRRYPVGCVAVDIIVSNNGKFAQADPIFLNADRQPCLRYASNGVWILKKTKTWKIVFNGSDAPPCSLRIPRDLIGSVCQK